MNYIRARLAEKGTWAGLLALAVAVAGMVWYARVGYKTGALAVVGTAVAAIPSNLRWLWPILARFAMLRAQKSTAAPVVVAAPNPVSAPLIFAKDDPNMSSLLAALEAKGAELAAAAEAELNAYTEKYLGQSVAQLGAEATSWYGDFQAAKTANSTKSWATLASQTAEMIDAQAKQIEALQTENATLKAAAPNAVITSSNADPAQPVGVIIPAT